MEASHRAHRRADQVTCEPFARKQMKAWAIKAFADPAVQQRISALGQTIPAVAELTPKALHDFHKAEIDKWHPIIKSYGIKVN